MNSTDRYERYKRNLPDVAGFPEHPPEKIWLMMDDPFLNLEYRNLKDRQCAELSLKRIEELKNKHAVQFKTAEYLAYSAESNLGMYAIYPDRLDFFLNKRGVSQLNQKVGKEIAKLTKSKAKAIAIIDHLTELGVINEQNQFCKLSEILINWIEGFNALIHVNNPESQQSATRLIDEIFRTLTFKVNVIHTSPSRSVQQKEDDRQGTGDVKSAVEKIYSELNSCVDQLKDSFPDRTNECEILETIRDLLRVNGFFESSDLILEFQPYLLKHYKDSKRLQFVNTLVPFREGEWLENKYSNTIRAASLTKKEFVDFVVFQTKSISKRWTFLRNRLTKFACEWEQDIREGIRKGSINGDHQILSRCIQPINEFLRVDVNAVDSNVSKLASMQRFGHKDFRDRVTQIYSVYRKVVAAETAFTNLLNSDIGANREFNKWKIDCSVKYTPTACCFRTFDHIIYDLLYAQVSFDAAKERGIVGGVIDFAIATQLAEAAAKATAPASKDKNNKHEAAHSLPKAHKKAGLKGKKIKQIKPKTAGAAPKKKGNSTATSASKDPKALACEIVTVETGQMVPFEPVSLPEVSLPTSLPLIPSHRAFSSSVLPNHPIAMKKNAAQADLYYALLGGVSLLNGFASQEDKDQLLFLARTALHTVNLYMEAGLKHMIFRGGAEDTTSHNLWTKVKYLKGDLSCPELRRHYLGSYWARFTRDHIEGWKDASKKAPAALITLHSIANGNDQVCRETEKTVNEWINDSLTFNGKLLKKVNPEIHDLEWPQPGCELELSTEPAAGQEADPWSPLIAALESYGKNSQYIDQWLDDLRSLRGAWRLIDRANTPESHALIVSSIHHLLHASVQSPLYAIYKEKTGDSTVEHRLDRLWNDLFAGEEGSLPEPFSRQLSEASVCSRYPYQYEEVASDLHRLQLEAITLIHRPEIETGFQLVKNKRGESTLDAGQSIPDLTRVRPLVMQKEALRDACREIAKVLEETLLPKF